MVYMAKGVEEATARATEGLGKVIEREFPTLTSRYKWRLTGLAYMPTILATQTWRLTHAVPNSATGWPRRPLRFNWKNSNSPHTEAKSHPSGDFPNLLSSDETLKPVDWALMFCLCSSYEKDRATHTNNDLTRCLSGGWINSYFMSNSYAYRSFATGCAVV